MTDPVSIPLVLAFDDGHARHAAVVLRSAATSLAADRTIDAHLIVADLADATEPALRRAEQELPNLEITFHHSDTHRYEGWLHGGHISAAAYLRLELADHLGSEIERAVYVDTDVLFLDSLHELFSSDLGGHPIGAVRDSTTPLVSSPRGLARYRTLGLPSDAPYFNSGVMVIDVPKWRTADPVGFARQYVAANRDVQNALDQEVLNACFAQRWQELPVRWNVNPRMRNLETWTDPIAKKIFAPDIPRALEDPALLHFLGPSKPWQFGSRKSWADLYMAQARSSPFYESRSSFLRWRAQEATRYFHRVQAENRRRLRRLRHRSVE